MDDKEIIQLLTKVDQKLETVAEDVSMLRHILLEGNGTPALTVQVATITQRVSQLEENEKDKKIPRSVWLSIAVSIVVGAFGFIKAIT